MKATELRIANMLKWEDESDDIVIIDSIISESNGQPSVKYHTPKNKKQSASMLFEFTGIPLTEEWLLKFNAVCQPWGWVLNGIIIRWNISRKTCKYWIELGNGKRIELPFVHTLQNFFALTGNELTIQP